MVEIVQSVVDQKTNFNFEVIVGDDCSIDLISINILKDFSRDINSD